MSEQTFSDLVQLFSESCYISTTDSLSKNAKIIQIRELVCDQLLKRLGAQQQPDIEIKNEEEKPIVAATPAQPPYRELIKASPVAFGEWYVLSHVPSTDVLPTKRPGVYELAFHSTVACSGVIYTGQSNDIRKRWQQHNNNTKKAFREYQENGLQLLIRWYETNNIEEADKIEKHLLSTYDYACNEDGQYGHPGGRLFKQTYIRNSLGDAILLSDFLLSSSQK
jgi:predicted GIY-YIG superfamily endonuclease